MLLESLKERLEQYDDNQFIAYMQQYWCHNKSQLFNMLTAVVKNPNDIDMTASTRYLILKYRKELTNWVLSEYKESQ